MIDERDEFKKNNKITATSIHEWGPLKGNKC